MNANDRIDRALAGLRDAQPRSGLNSRILASLDHRTEHGSTRPGGLPFRIAKGWGIARGSARGNTGGNAHLALWAATSAAILAITSLAILHHQTDSFAGSHTKTVILSEASHSDAQSKDPETARVPTNPKPFSTTNLATESPRTPTEPTHRLAHPSTATLPAACPQSGCPIHDGAAVMGGVTTADYDAQALADLHAPSHPAPPLPLTPEEKLFRRMLQYRNATQLAELDPIVRAKENADETTAFKAFFPDPPPLKQPLGDTE